MSVFAAGVFMFALVSTVYVLGDRLERRQHETRPPTPADPADPADDLCPDSRARRPSTVPTAGVGDPSPLDDQPAQRIAAYAATINDCSPEYVADGLLQLRVHLAQAARHDP